MSINKLLWSIATIALASNAHAGLIQVTIIPGADQHPDGLHDTWQIIAVFDDANDKLLSVGGEPFSLIFFTGGGELYNQAIYDGLPENDFPSVGIGGEAYDSYITIGATTFPHNTQFFDDTFGDWGGNPPPVQVIKGSSFGGQGGWFYIGDPPPVSELDLIPDNDTFEVIIAQFTVDMNVGFHLEGNIHWMDDGGTDGNFTPFVVDNIPAPGAAVLFGIATITSTRRRRR